MMIEKTNILALQHYKEFIETNFLQMGNMEFVSKHFLENTLWYI